MPLNALLQERGQQSVGAGHAIAIQNLAENSMMLVMIGAYTMVMPGRGFRNRGGGRLRRNLVRGDRRAVVVAGAGAAVRGRCTLIMRSDA